METKNGLWTRCCCQPGRNIKVNRWGQTPKILIIPCQVWSVLCRQCLHRTSYPARRGGCLPSSENSAQAQTSTRRKLGKDGKKCSFTDILSHFSRLNTSTAMTWCSTMCFIIFIKNKPNSFLLQSSHPLALPGILDHRSPLQHPIWLHTQRWRDKCRVRYSFCPSFWNFIIIEKVVRILSESNQRYIFLSTVLFLRWNFSIHFTCHGLTPAQPYFLQISDTFPCPVLFYILCWVSFVRHDNFYIEYHFSWLDNLKTSPGSVNLFC